MKRLAFVLVAALFIAAAASAQTEIAPPPTETGGGGGSYYSPSLTYHGGKVMAYAPVVYLFWGSFPFGYADELVAYRDNSDGMPSAMDMLDQYSAPQTWLYGGQSDRTDATNPPHVNVTKNDVQDELLRIFGSSLRTDTVYVVFLPNGYYASKSDGTTSCGGSGQHFCAYHSVFYPAFNLLNPIKFAVIPFASCDVCHKYDMNGVWANDVQNAEVMTLHEVRETMTNPEGDGWYDIDRQEADDKCAFVVDHFDRPDNIFTVRGWGARDAPVHIYWFQKEWSNAAHSCVPY